MNPTIRQSRTILQWLCFLTSQGTAKMYQRKGCDEPARILHHIFVPSGGITFEVIERSTGTAKGEPASHKPAKKFARTLLHWITGSALLLILFAYFGAGH